MNWLKNKLKERAQWKCINCGTIQGFENQACTNCGENMMHSIHETTRIENEKEISILTQKKIDGIKFYSKILKYILIWDLALTGIYWVINLITLNINVNSIIILAGMIPTLIFLFLLPRKPLISNPDEYGIIDIINHLFFNKVITHDKFKQELLASGQSDEPKNMDNYQSLLSTKSANSIVLYEKKNSTLLKIFWAIIGVLVIVTIVYFIIKNSIVFSKNYIYGLPLLLGAYFSFSEAHKNRDNKIILSEDKLEITHRQIKSEVKFADISHESSFKDRQLHIYLKSGDSHSINFGFFDTYNADQILFEINSRIKK